MIAPIDKVRGEGNCARATVGGKEAGARAARLRTETFYKAGSVRRVSTTSRCRSQTTVQVKDELVQPQITLLSGETCLAVMHGGDASTSKACLKTRNALAQAKAGGAGVSSGRSTASTNPMWTGRTKR